MYRQHLLLTLFQSTLPQRERRLTHGEHHTHTKFQSTLPQRERRPCLCISSLRFYFNPHSHKGSDSCLYKSQYAHANFNPHSHKGSDNTRFVAFLFFWNFNPHSHKGSDFRIMISVPLMP